MSNLASVLDSYKRGDQQQVQALLRTIASETPEVSATFKGIVQDLITTIEKDVHTKINQGKTDTENEILARISTLETAAGVANTGYSEAKKADENLYVCMSSEKQHQEQIEKEKGDLDEALAATVAPCNNKEANRVYTREEQVPFSFSCDFSVPETESNSCTKQMESFDSSIQTNLGQLDEASGIQVKDWNSFNDQCNAAWEAHAVADTDHKNAQSAHGTKQEECAQLKTTRDSEICSFGGELQAKCAAYASYNDIIDDLEVAGEDYSQFDRRAEWADTEQMRCLLQDHYDNDVLSNSETAAQAIEKCVAETNFESQGGDLGLEAKQSRVDAVMGPIDSAENYLCTEGKTFNFYNGLEWIVNQGETLESTDYQTSEFKPVFDLTAGEDPFSTC